MCISLEVLLSLKKVLDIIKWRGLLIVLASSVNGNDTVNTIFIHHQLVLGDV